MSTTDAWKLTLLRGMRYEKTFTMSLRTTVICLVHRFRFVLRMELLSAVTVVFCQKDGQWKP